MWTDPSCKRGIRETFKEGGHDGCSKQRECSCSSDLELAWNQNIAFKEMNERLELSIRYGKCPHVLMQLCGIAVNYDQDFLTAELSKYTQQLENSNPLRNAMKCTAGFYWIHLAVLFRKEKLIQYCFESPYIKIPNHLLISLKHKISPVLLAVVHQLPNLAKSIASFNPSLIWSAAENIDVIGTNTEDNIKMNGLTWTTKPKHYDHLINLFDNEHNINHVNINAITWAMKHKHYDTLIDLLNLVDNYHLVEGDVSTIWFHDIKNAILCGNDDDIYSLARVKGVEFFKYLDLIGFLLKSGRSKELRIVLEKTDFCAQSINKTTKERRFLMAEIVAAAAFEGDVTNLSLLIEFGFEINAKYLGISLLSWVESLNMHEISEVLSEAGVSNKKFKMKKDSMIDLAVCFVGHPWTDMIDKVRVVHLLYKNGHVIFDSDTSLTNTWKNGDDRLMKYFLLRGENPQGTFDSLQHGYYAARRGCRLFFYLVVTSNSVLSVKHWLITCRLLNYYEVLEILPDIMDLSSIQDIVTNGAMEWLEIEKIPYTSSEKHIQWYRHVRSLQKICRRVLCSHYKGFKYIRFLKYNEKSIPSSILSFLKKDDVLQKFLSDSQRDEYDESVHGVDEYFL
ncbi:uncharacterized protein LOC127702033 isoform X3 [Mytilus californianus]|uniref:uncharacterized protein LOC127702033 isoform X3 n=1 Tax=Mytilus californianus TaxID=6549 RepID=UPI0022477DE0|nr:uncharacterized protein LOC127702033 isoform X3 [Mytilus californianus]